jgi:hypothetical protein
MGFHASLPPCRAIGGCGNDVVIRSNTVYNAVMQNYANTSAVGWTQAISYVSRPPASRFLISRPSCNCHWVSWRRSNACYNDGKLVTNWVFEYNTVYNSWGEGIDAVQVNGCIVRHNVVYNAYSVLICRASHHPLFFFMSMSHR